MLSPTTIAATLPSLGLSGPNAPAGVMTGTPIDFSSLMVDEAIATPTGNPTPRNVLTGNVLPELAAASGSGFVSPANVVLPPDPDAPGTEPPPPHAVDTAPLLQFAVAARQRDATARTPIAVRLRALASTAPFTAPLPGSSATYTLDPGAADASVVASSSEPGATDAQPSQQPVGIVAPTLQSAAGPRSRDPMMRMPLAARVRALTSTATAALALPVARRPGTDAAKSEPVDASVVASSAREITNVGPSYQSADTISPVPNPAVGSLPHDATTRVPMETRAGAATVSAAADGRGSAAPPPATAAPARRSDDHAAIATQSMAIAEPVLASPPVPPATDLAPGTSGISKAAARDERPAPSLTKRIDAVRFLPPAPDVLMVDRPTSAPVVAAPFPDIVMPDTIVESGVVPSTMPVDRDDPVPSAPDTIQPPVRFADPSAGTTAPSFAQGPRAFPDVLPMNRTDAGPPTIAAVVAAPIPTTGAALIAPPQTTFHDDGMTATLMAAMSAPTQQAMRVAGPVVPPSPTTPTATPTIAFVTPDPRFAAPPVAAPPVARPTERPPSPAMTSPATTTQSEPVSAAMMQPASASMPRPRTAPVAKTPLIVAAGEPREDARPPATPVVAASAAPAAGLAPTTAAAPLDLRRETWPHAMVERIAAQVEAVRDAADARDTRIRIAPDALGTIDLSVRTDGDTVHVHFAAEQSQTRAMLADAQPRLVEIAETRGLRLGGTTIDAGQSQSLTPSQSQFQPQSQSQAQTQSQSQSQAQSHQRQPTPRTNPASNRPASIADRADDGGRIA